MGEAAADEVGVQLVHALFDGSFGEGEVSETLFELLAAFTAPRATAALGRALRRAPEATWPVDRALRLLTELRSDEAAVQLRICSRDAVAPAVLIGAHRAYRGFTSAMLGLLGMGAARVPQADLARYLSINLKDAMLHGTKFSAAELRQAVAGEGRLAMTRLVWASYHGRAVEKTFRVDLESAAFVDDEFEEVNLADERHVGVVHPAELDDDVRERWGLALGDFEIVTLFPQLDRNVVHAPADFPYARIERSVPWSDGVRTLASCGWTEQRSEWAFTTRGSRLTVSVSTDHADELRFEELSYRSTLGRERSIHHDIAYSESLAAAVELLDTVAPDLL